MRLVRVESLGSLSRLDDAHAALHEARDRILQIRRSLDDPALRDSYVTRIPANARTMQLAREWLGGEGS